MSAELLAVQLKDSMRKYTFLLSLVALLVLPGCQRSSPTFPLDESIPNSQGSVYYEIFVGSFYDGNGDGKGDLSGVTAKIPYLKSLGVKGIWLMPIHPSPSYHKYDVTDYYTIDPSYGTLTDFDNLMAVAKENGIEVLLDLVINHTSDRHPWFIQAKDERMNGKVYPKSKADWYNFTNKATTGYTQLKTGLYYESRFYSGMPDLNLDNEEVRAEIQNITSFWLNKGVQGFRLDAVSSYYTLSRSTTITFLTWLNSMIKSLFPDAYIVGEGPWGTTYQEIIPYYASGIDSFFNFTIANIPDADKVYAYMRQRKGQELSTLISRYNEELKAVNPLALDAPFISNHDNNRFSGKTINDFKLERFKLMASIYLLMPGRPFMYYGEEIGLLGQGNDPSKRLPMIWDEVDKTGQTLPPPGIDFSLHYQIEKGVNDLLDDPDSIINHYRKVINSRNKFNSYIEKATITPFISEQMPIYGLTYTSPSGQLLILTNFSEEDSLPIKIAEKVEVVDYFDIMKKPYQLNKDGVVSLPAFSTLIFKLVA